MLLQFGMNCIISNLIALIGTYSNHKDIKNSDDLRKKFMGFLDVLQPREKARNGNGIDFISNVVEAAVFGDYFSNDSLLDDKSQSKIILREKCEFSEKKMDLIKSGMDKIGFLEAGHHELIDVVLSDVFVLPSERARAGSTSRALGVIWLNPKLSYGIGDLVEMIVHELTHQLMFIDDLRRPHYNYALILDVNNWPVSAVLNIRRPFDKVLHSAVVAMEVLLLRKFYIGDPRDPAVHPPTEVLKGQLFHAMRSMDEVLNENNDVLDAGGHRIFGKLKLNLEDFM